VDLTENPRPIFNPGYKFSIQDTNGFATTLFDGQSGPKWLQAVRRDRREGSSTPPAVECARGEGSPGVALVREAAVDLVVQADGEAHLLPLRAVGPEGQAEPRVDRRPHVVGDPSRDARGYGQVVAGDPVHRPVEPDHGLRLAELLAPDELLVDLGAVLTSGDPGPEVDRVAEWATERLFVGQGFLLNKAWRTVQLHG